MKKILTMSLVAAAATTMAFGSTADDIADLQAQIDKLKTKQGKINAQSANDNIKWGVDFRTSYDNINYDMADGSSRENNALFSERLWLNMAYAPDSHNIFKGQLSMNKAFGADLGGYDSSMSRAMSMGGMFDWTANEALTDNNLKVRQAYWLYLGDTAFGADIPWTFSLGRRPSTNGFLSNLSQDDEAQSPLAHVINVEFDGLSSKIDLSNITGVPGMTLKFCGGIGASSAVPMFDRLDGTTNSDADDVDDVTMAGLIFEPYNDGQFIVKTTWYRAFNLPGYDEKAFQDAFMQGHATGIPLSQSGDIDGAALSVLVDGITEDGYFSDAKIFGSFAWSNTNPDSGINPNTGTAYNMLGSTDSESGTSFWMGAYLPVGEGAEYGTVGLEYNHGSEYWRPFTYAEDTMIGSKIAARGDAYEINYTYQINDALSIQARYVDIDYEYTGSNSFFGSDGTPMKIDDVKDGAAMWTQLGGTGDPMDPASSAAVVGNLMASGMDQASAMAAAGDMAMATAMTSQIVEAAQDFRLYLRYRF